MNVTDNQHEAGNTGTSVSRDLCDYDGRYNLEEHDHQTGGLSSENKCRAGKSAVRKLFNEDISQEKGHDEYINNTDKEAILPAVRTIENDLEGLSYFDSQEPGEESQTNALDVVDKYLKCIVTDFDQESDIIKSTGGNSKVLSGAKGTLSFAKLAYRSYSAEAGIFDWDDNQEDGESEFFRKTKEPFFDGGCIGNISFTQPRDSNQNQRDTNTFTDFRVRMDSLAGPKSSKRKRRTASNTDDREKSDIEMSGTSTVQKEESRQKLPEEEIIGKSDANLKISKVNSGTKRTTRSSVRNPALPLVDRQSGKSLAKDTYMVHYPFDQNDSTSKDANVFLTPIGCTTPVNEASPICMGDEYQTRSRRKNLLRSPLQKEFSRTADGPEYAWKNLGKRRDITQLQVLFSQHLDGEIIKQQKKVLAQLGASVASCISDATHFVADRFVRTRNMLEAIATGKPVVTHFWLESCGHARCLFDERNYILRDAEKEKEMGYSLPVSLALSCQHPLLKGRKVFITRNTKPSKDILAGLVKAVHGVAVERIGRSALKDERFPSDLIVLSCEEDFVDCVPFLEKGASVYSSELLLNGIVIQKLEYERYRLFADNVRKTRSTIWLRKDGELVSVTKCK